MVRSAELAAEWLAQLPQRRSPAYSGAPDDVVAAVVADERALGEVFGLLRANRVMSPENARLLQERPDELGRALAQRLREKRELYKEQLPRLIQALRNTLATLGAEVQRLVDDLGA